jgi:hypothetical protein
MKYRVDQMAAAIYRQQKVLSHFPVCCWIDWLLMIKNCLIEPGPPCRVALTETFQPASLIFQSLDVAQFTYRKCYENKAHPL